MATDGSRLEISGDVNYFQYLSIGLYVIHPTLCFLKIFELSRKFRKNRQFDISESHRAFNRWQLMDLDCKSCLLYTSDAADEEDSVDIGGRRIIKTITHLTRHSL